MVTGNWTSRQYNTEKYICSSIFTDADNPTNLDPLQRTQNIQKNGTKTNIDPIQFKCRQELSAMN
uniref:Uncharacterized protein n=1 Tax=Nelumbo nucifera TaxID=4432 RepID=A0A822Z2Y1_NELNU|nr:TPA_asm: hypothetical protein HUJ06_013705 [Nelumbo nucifera]